MCGERPLDSSRKLVEEFLLTEIFGVELAEEEEFPFDELPEEVEAVEEVAAPDSDEGDDQDYLPITLYVQSVNQRSLGDGRIETQVNARVMNESQPIEGLKVRCTISLNLEGAPGDMPKVAIGNIIDVMV